MDKHTAIVIIASIIIVVPFAYSGWNIYALDNLQIKGTDEGKFRFFDMSSEASIEICNPSPFYVSFNKLYIVTFFDGASKGVFSIEPVTLAPASSVILNGTFSSESFSEAQYLYLHFDSMFSGTAPERIDPRKLNIITEIDAPIIGVIPYSVSKQQSGLYFWEALNGRIGEFSC